MLLCKEKFESIEEIQREQSKVLFDLVNKSTSNSNGIDPMFLSVSMIVLQQLLLQKKKIKIISYDLDETNMLSGGTSDQTVLKTDTLMENDDSDDEETESEEEDSDDEESDDEESETDAEVLVEVPESNNDLLASLDLVPDEDKEDVEVKLIKSDEDSNEENINLDKMTISELKSYIESKGGKLSSKTTKKNDILEFIKTNSL